jgi:hypothetical protein
MFKGFVKFDGLSVPFMPNFQQLIYNFGVGPILLTSYANNAHASAINDREPRV